jgi:hypothetical protein
MELRQLRYFIAIVDHGSLSRAAKVLHIVQPALTQQLQHLEEELVPPCCTGRRRACRRPMPASCFMNMRKPY